MCCRDEIAAVRHSQPASNASLGRVGLPFLEREAFFDSKSSLAHFCRVDSVEKGLRSRKWPAERPKEALEAALRVPDLPRSSLSTSTLPRKSACAAVRMSLSGSENN